MPNAKPLILNRSAIRLLLQYGQGEIRRPVRSVGTALQERWTVGDRFWVREGFSTRRDGESNRIRAAVDRGPGEEVVRVVAIVPGLKRFATDGYRSWEAKFMPRLFSRLTVELVEVRTESTGDGRELVLRLKVVTAGSEGRQ